jgi:hypothetical protein
MILGAILIFSTIPILPLWYLFLPVLIAPSGVAIVLLHQSNSHKTMTLQMKDAAGLIA